jgi:hypothetical protein
MCSNWKVWEGAENIVIVDVGRKHLASIRDHHCDSPIHKRFMAHEICSHRNFDVGHNAHDWILKSDRLLSMVYSIMNFEMYA